MKKLLVFISLLIIFAVWFSDFVRSGGLESYIDTHPGFSYNPQIEYYWAVALDAASHKKSAEYRYRRILKKYADTPIAPDAWVALIELLENTDRKQDAVNEGMEFLLKYPDNPKSAMIKRKIEMIKNG